MLIILAKRSYFAVMKGHSILRDFQDMHIDLVWDELRLRFGFDLKRWKIEFQDYLATQPRNTADTDAFIRFGNHRINPVINQILRRNELFPTFNKLVEYILSRPASASGKQDPHQPCATTNKTGPSKKT